VATIEEWSRAFAARNVLCRDAALPVCHQLHFLQLACEKLSKAHLCTKGSNSADLQSSHAFVQKTLPLIAREQFLNTNDRQLSNKSWMMAHIRHFPEKSNFSRRRWTTTDRALTTANTLGLGLSRTFLYLPKMHFQI